jgi:glycosyltransferase involved in cell wall biosynthesis
MASRQVNIMVVSFTGDTGLTDYSASLCRELSKLTTVELVTAQSFDEQKYQASYPITKLFRRTRQFPVDIFRFVAHVLRTRPKVLLFQSWMKSAALELPLVLLFRVVGIRVVLTVHDLLPHHPRPWSRLECALYYKTFNALVVHSQKQLAGLHDMGVYRSTLVVPHGVYDIFNTKDLGQPAARACFPAIAAGDFVVLFFGYLDERKGVMDYIEAARQLQHRPEIKFVLAGKPDSRAAVVNALSLAKQLPNTVVADHMIDHEEVQNYFAACDAVALPYREGTTSGVMKLAMAFGKPVICTDVGDFSESVAVWSGLLIANTELPNSLVRGVEKMYAERAAFIGQTHHLVQDLQWDTIAEKYARHALSITKNNEVGVS